MARAAGTPLSPSRWSRTGHAPDGPPGVGLDDPGAVQVVVVGSRVAGGQQAPRGGCVDLPAALRCKTQTWEGHAGVTGLFSYKETAHRACVSYITHHKPLPVYRFFLFLFPSIALKGRHFLP